MMYKGYEAVVTFDDEADLFHGAVINTRDVITFQGQSVKALRTEFRKSVEDYLEFSKSRGEEPEKPFSGKLVLRLAPDLHRAVALGAKREGRNPNAYIAERLAAECR